MRLAWDYISVGFFAVLTLALCVVAGAYVNSPGIEITIYCALLSLGISALLLRRNLKRLHSRMDRKTTRFLEERQRLHAQQQALLKLASTESRYAGNITPAIQELVETAAGTLDVERVAYWVLTEPQTLECRDLFERSLCAHSQGLSVSANSHPLLFQSLHKNRVIVIHDIENSGFAAEMADIRSIGVAALILAPVHVHGHLHGLICLSHAGGPRRWTYDEQHFAGSIADMASLIIQGSEQRRTKQELELKSLAIEAAVDGMAILDEQQRFTYLNRAHAQVYGYDHPSELIGKSWRILYDERELARFDMELMPKFLRAGQLRIEAIGKKKDGSLFPQEISLTALPSGGLICVCQDVTETKKLQRELLQSQKMEAIGQLAGGIAHDFNNLLTGILGCTGLLRMTQERNPDVLQAVDTIESAAQRASQLTTKLLGFARKGKHQNVPVDIHATIEETLLLLRRTIEKNIVIVQRLKANSPYILGDPTQLQQIVLNLAINSRDAMSPDIAGHDGGELTIETRIVDGSDGLRLDPEREIGQFLELSVSDTGCGIPPEDRERIFEPFYTTKPPGRGTGMGLAMVYGIVKNHDGIIQVESKVGKGTSFRLYFPCLDAESVTSLSRPPIEPLTGCGHILVVDDHNIVRAITTKMLRSLGYRVVTAKDGIEAVEYYRENGHEIDLLILDMVMPRMGARDCFRCLKEINPNVLAILSTGYVNNNHVQEIMNEGMAGFIQKPYQLSQLSQVVAEVLRRSAPRNVNEHGDCGQLRQST
ncbi:MAG: response regulator [Oligoflexia bacterium]|nr:response regulator [Oligoflexia bacterium]